MDFKLEVIPIPVTDVQRARDFYVDRLGFTSDFDAEVAPGERLVQVTPPGSACSVFLGRGITGMAPGSQRGLMMVVDDADAARAELAARGVEVSEVDELSWGRFVHLSDPDGNTWSIQQLPEQEWTTG